MSTSTLTVAVATVSVCRAVFTLSGDIVQYQPLLSTFNEKTIIKKYDGNSFSDHFELSSSEDSGHSGHPPSLISVFGGRIKKAEGMRTEPISQMARTITIAFIPFELFPLELWPSTNIWSQKVYSFSRYLSKNEF